jgi:peptidoglycan/LPS O-acetylase OafA/YrhL
MALSFASDPAAKPRNLDALTGLRFFAALAVGLYHIPYVLTQSVGATVLPNGSLGVSFFFILSGFILTHVYHDRQIDRPEFWWRRFARIYPLHFLTAVIWMLMYFRGWGNPMQEKLNSTVANFLLVQAFFSGPLFNLGLNAVSWSISVEAFFYAIFPFACRRFMPFLLVLLGFFMDVGLPGAWYPSIQQAFPNFFYFNPVGRLLEFAFGIVCYRAWFHIKVPPLVSAVAQIAAVVLLFVLIPASSAMPENYRNALLVWPFGAVIVSFALDGPAARLLGLKGFVILGEASFAFYMIHHMLFRMIDGRLALLHAGGLVAGILAFSFAVIAAIGIHYGFERPARAILSRGSNRR